MAEQMAAFVRDFGANVVGGCCGTTPEHIRQLVEAVRAVDAAAPPPAAAPGRGERDDGRRAAPGPAPADRRRARQHAGLAHASRSSCSRTTTTACSAVAREQVEYGAHALDVCVAVTERSDEPEQLREVVKRLAHGRRGAADDRHARAAGAAQPRWRPTPAARSSTPSTWRTAATASRPYVPLAVEHGAAVVALTIDEAGMAKTARARSCAVARRIHDICVDEYGLAPEDLIFDALTFTLATGDEEWIDSARRDHRGHPADQARAARRADVARRLQRLVRPLAARRARSSTPSSCTTAWRPGSTWRWSTRRTPWPTWRSRTRSASSPTTWSTTAGPTRCRG